MNTVKVKLTDMETDAEGELGEWTLDQLDPLVTALKQWGVIGGVDPENDAAGVFVIDDRNDTVYLSITTAMC